MYDNVNQIKIKNNDIKQNKSSYYLV